MQTQTLARPSSQPIDHPVPLEGPEFIVIGAMKCATSTVSAYLEDHPEVFMVAGQDPDYFSKPMQVLRGPDWYAALFADARPGQIRGEGSNSYTWDSLYPGTAARLVAACPGIRLIFLVRDPIARIVSHWVQVRADQGDAVPACLAEAIRTQPDRLVAPSLYWRQLSHYRALVPDNRIWIGFVEDLEADRAGVLGDLCGFLGISDRAPDAPIHRNPSAGKRVPGALYSRLRRLPGARRLAGALPGDLKHWLKTRALARRAATAAALDAGTRAHLADVLRADSHAFLAHCGKPVEFWESLI